MALTKVTGQVIKNTTDVTVGVLTVTNTLAVGGTVSIGGTLTYEDVTNVDAVGLITARDGIKVGSGITLSVDGDGFFTGVITATSYSGIDLSDVTGATGDFSIADKIVHTGDTNTALRFPAADTFTVETGGSERARIDSSGRLMVGHNSSLAIGGGDNAPLQTSATSSVVFGGVRYTNASGGPFLSLSKSRAAAAGSNTIVQDDDELGTIIFSGDDGTDLISKGAQISAAVDGTPGSNDMPGRLVFSTTADGSASPTERLRIDSVGRLLLGHTAALTVNSSQHRFQLIGTDYATSGLSQQRYQNDGSGASLLLAHSRNGTIGSHTALQSGDELGKIRFMGSDGSDFAGEGAEISVVADGNYSSNSLPSKMQFKTTPNGSNGSTTRMTIDQNGYVKINSTDSNSYHTIRLDTSTNNAMRDVVQILSSVTGATAADGFGSRLLFSGENLNGNNYTFGAVAGKLSTTGSNYGHLSFFTNNNGTVAEKMRLTDSSSGQLQVLGNSASVKTIESGGAIAMMQSGGNQAYFGTPSGNSKAVTFTVAGSQIAHFTTGGDMMLDNALQTSSGVEPVGTLSFSGPNSALQNQTDMYRINFWESARTISSTRTDHANASIRYCASTDDGGDGSIRFSNENGTRLLYMNRLGNGGTSGSWSVGSDQRKKENITTVSDALTKVSQLRGVDFNWKAKWGGHADSGVIAQEVESVLPNLVLTQEGARDTDDDGNSVVMKHVNYNGLWGAMIEAVKELKSKNEALEARIAALEG